jgi:hypothetical protein
VRCFARHSGSGDGVPLKQTKDQLLDSIENCMNVPLDNIAPGARASVRKLSWMHLRALERGFQLAYQDGYDRGTLSATEGEK